MARHSQRVRQLASVGGVESVGVLLIGVTGLLIVNWLPKEQYAEYTFLLACITLVMGATDLGLVHCVLPIVGERAGDERWVVGVTRRVFGKRVWLLAAGLIVVTPYWVVVSVRQDWFAEPRYLAAAAVGLAIIPLTLRENYATTILIILRRITRLTRVNLAGYVARAACVVALVLFATGGWSLVGVMAATALGLVVSVLLHLRALRLERLAAANLDRNDGRVVDRELVRLARPLVVPTIYYHVQGTITVFLVAWLGATDAVADLGAVTRLGLVVLVLDRVLNVLLFPAIARRPPGPELTSAVRRANLLYVAIGAVAVLSAFAVPEYWVIILGDQYASVEPLVWLVVLTSLLQSASAFVFRILTARGHTHGQTWGVPLLVAVQLAYVVLVGVDGLRSVLGMALSAGVMALAFQWLMMVRALRDWARPVNEGSRTPVEASDQ